MQMGIIGGPSCAMHRLDPVPKTLASGVGDMSLTLDLEERSFTPAQFRKFMFAQIAEDLGIRNILHTDYRSTCADLASFRLQIQQQHACPVVTLA